MNMHHVDAIVFQDLYPLYGSTDIRGSSQHRNEAIQADLSTHLGIVSTTLAACRTTVPLTLIDEIKHRVDVRIEEIKNNWSTSDESDIALNSISMASPST